MQTRVAGIPCQILVTSYYPATPMKYWKAEEYWQPPQDAEIEWEVLDRRGRPAPWLAKKLDQQGRHRIELELLEDIKHRNDEDY